jgi:3-hydroxybutyryl-CoA dehydratase
VCVVIINNEVQRLKPKAAAKEMIRAKQPFCNFIHRFYGRRRCYFSTENISGTIPHGGIGVAIGQFAELERVFSVADVSNFATLVGDHNPLHADWKKGSEPLIVTSSPLVQWNKSNAANNNTNLETTTTSSVLVHGILASSLFSSIIGTLIPGSIYRNQSLDFKKPIYANELVRGCVTIQSIRNWKRKGLLITMDTTVWKRDEACIRGSASVWMVHATIAKEAEAIR